jgi:type I restriction enzyme S subunit
VETTLEQATAGVFTGPFGSLLHKHDYIENGIPLVNPAHITDTGIEPDMRKTVSEATAKRLANYIMNEGDVVIGRRGEMGRCALVTEVEDGWLCGTGSFFIKPSERCDMGYLVHYLRSDGCRKHLEALAGGAVMPNLSNTALGGLSIFLPSLREQKEIVNEIDALSAETQRLASLYERKLAALEALKKSLLHQAFSGTL